MTDDKVAKAAMAALDAIGSKDYEGMPNDVRRTARNKFQAAFHTKDE